MLGIEIVMGMSGQSVVMELWAEEEYPSPDGAEVYDPRHSYARSLHHFHSYSHSSCGYQHTQTLAPHSPVHYDSDSADEPLSLSS